MPTDTAVLTQQLPFVENLFHYHRRKTRVVNVGHIGVGGNNPIRVQSMTTTPTTDIEATVAQTLRMVAAGCEIVRITAPTLADARALGPIKKSLLAQGCNVPLVADIHFNPECAMEAAEHVEKIRVNPGNYADSKIFKIKEYSDEQYAAELARLEERFTPLVLKCRRLGRSMRLGSNHGSLSDRILNRYGDSPEGMVESALEFVRICRKNNYHELILSMKSSNVKVMIAAYRLLAVRMADEKMDYPFHLGVTEAGYGEDGRIKSAIGIGSLLNDGIGDTIRVSLTEDPEFEVPVAFEIAKPYQPDAQKNLADTNAASNGNGTLAADEKNLSHVDNYFHYARRVTHPIRIGPFKPGGENVVRVINDFSLWLVTESDPQKKAAMLVQFFEQQLASGKGLVPEILEWTVLTPADLEALKVCRKAVGGVTSTLAFLGRFTDLALAKESMGTVHAAVFTAPRTLSTEERIAQFKDFLRTAKESSVAILLESGPCHRGYLEPAQNLLNGIKACEEIGAEDVLISFNLPTVQQLIANVRRLVSLLRAREKGPLAGYPLHLRMPGSADLEKQRIEAAVAFGALLCDGIGDTVQTGLGQNPGQDLELLYNVLQGAGVRITKTEFVSCPSCGRTLFDLQSTTERIKEQTGHLKGVKIAIMGCIVNGPGEMADADFGYVGGATGRINLYVGKTCVEKGIPSESADFRLVELIKAHGKWVDPK